MTDMKIAGAEGIKIDASFPGGNIVFERIDGDVVMLHQDLRDTACDWFYWYFRVRGAEGRTLTFRFTGSESIGVRGPACSLDGGLTWTWLGSACVKEKEFTFMFMPESKDVRFSFAMPYLEDAFKRFLDGLSSPALCIEELCKSRKGRPVELLRLGCLASEPKRRVLFTCRHHCCEMMASYVLEGVIEQILSGTETGRWLCDNIEFMILPFADKDGVEDGDQGKNRKPHDHNFDYYGESLYPEVAALKRRVPEWVADKPCYGFDMHCPWIRGEAHECIMSPSLAYGDPENWRRLRPFLEILEKTKSGPLDFRIADSEKFVSWDGKPPGPKGPPNSASRWMCAVPGIQWALTFEVPYATASGQEVNQQTARNWGHDFAVALREYLSKL